MPAGMLFQIIVNAKTSLNVVVDVVILTVFYVVAVH